MEVEHETNIIKEVVRRLSDQLAGLRMRKEQLDVHLPSSKNSSKVTSTILGLPTPATTSEASLKELLKLGTSALDVLQKHEFALRKPTKKQRIFENYLNIAVVYVGTGLERKDVVDFEELIAYMKEQVITSRPSMGNMCFMSLSDDAYAVSFGERKKQIKKAKTIALKKKKTADKMGVELITRGLSEQDERMKRKEEKKLEKKEKRSMGIGTLWVGGVNHDIGEQVFSEAASVSAIFLLGEVWNISVDDMLLLCQSMLKSVPLEKQFYVEEAQARRDQHHSMNSRYTQHQSYNLHGSFEEKALCFSFPEEPPEFSSDLLMNVWQPHAVPPSKFGYALWGSSKMIPKKRRMTVTDEKLYKEDEDLYKGLMILPDSVTLETHINVLNEMVLYPVSMVEPSENGDPLFLSWMKLHWIHAAAPTIVAEVHKVVAKLSEMPVWLERLRFESTVSASEGRANYLLQLYHNFRLSAFLAKRMKKQLDDILIVLHNREQEVVHLTKSTDWIASLSDDCAFWYSECDRLCKDTGLLRRFVLEQRELSQSTRGFVLTILASIFIPLSFVATFFGMNTVEINNPESKWKIKYYFWAAFPLAIVTVFLPFIVGPALRWTARSGANVLSRPVLKFVLILISFAYFLTVELLCLNVRYFSNQNGNFETCIRISTANYVFRMVFGILALCLCYFEVNHRRQLDPTRKTRPWVISVVIAHFRWREGWRRMWLYYVVAGTFIASCLFFNIAQFGGSSLIMWIIPYTLYFTKIAFRILGKFKRNEIRVLKGNGKKNVTEDADAIERSM